MTARYRPKSHTARAPAHAQIARSHRTLIVSAVASFLVATLPLVGCDGQKSVAKDRRAEAPKQYPVIAVQPQPASLHIDVPATVLGKQNVEIRPMVDGFVERIFVDEGAWVKAGQKLFEIKAPQYEQAVRTAEAGIKTAQAAVSNARLQADKVRPLVEREIISAYELQSSEFALAQREAELAQARAALVNARTNLSYTTITSPTDGVIGSLPLKIGSLISTSMEQPLTTVSNIDEVYAYFSVNEKVLLSLTRDAAGNSLQERLASAPPVHFILADGREYEESGTLQAASGLIDSQTGSTRFRATFPNPRKLLRSGSSGIVRIPRDVPNALVVPQRAVFELQGKYFLYVVLKDNTIRATAITVRALPDGQSYIVDSGLQPGDRVVLDGLASLRDGTTIDPVAPQPPQSPQPQKDEPKGVAH